MVRSRCDENGSEAEMGLLGEMYKNMFFIKDPGDGVLYNGKCWRASWDYF